MSTGIKGKKPPFKVEYKSLCKSVERIDVVKEMYKSDYSNTSYRKFGKCRQSYYVSQCGKCGKIDLSGSRCESKICPECGQKKMNKLIAQNIDFLNLLPTNPRGKKRATLLTLTIKNVPDSEYGRDSYNKLADCWREFKEHPQIKPKLRGGLYAIETKRPPEDYVYRSGVKVAPGRSWNLHIHALVDADYLHWRVVRGIWKKITGHSHNVDLRAVRASVPALCECLKYAVKPPNLGDAKSYLRYLRVTKNLRLYNTFGTFHGHFQLSKKIHDKYQKKCPVCKTRMRYCFEIGLKESLRYQQLLKGGPPLDRFGRSYDMGFPETFGRLINHEPFLGKTKTGGVA